MKHFYLQILIVAVFAACSISCNSLESGKTLHLSEQLMSEKPDSALNILLDVNPDDLHTKRQRAKHALLLSMALDKNYIDVADDSLTQIAYNYYIKHGNNHYKMLSAYYLGVVHQNAGDNIQAAIEFEQSLTLADDLGDNHNAGLSCQHLSSIYSNNYDHVSALDYSRRAVDYFETCGEALSADFSRISMAVQYSRNKEWGQATEIIDTILSTSNNRPLLRNALWLKTDILTVYQQDYKSALSYLEMIPLRRQRTDTLTYYEYKAFLLCATGRLSESDYYYRQAEDLVDNGIDSLTFLNQKSGAYRIRGDYKNAYYVLTEANDIQYKEIQNLLGQSVTHAMENHYRESLEKEKERSYTHRIVFLLSTVILLLFVMGLVLYARKLRLDRMQDMADIDSLNNDLQALQAKNTFFRKTADSVIIDKVQFLQQLSESYFSWTDEEVKKREKRYGIQTKDELISVFRQQLGEIRSDKRLIISLEEAVNSSNDNLIQRLRTEYRNKLKEEDFSTLTLLYSGLSVKSIAFYLRITEPALRTRKTRYKHFFEENPTASSAEFIQRISSGDSSLRSE